MPALVTMPILRLTAKEKNGVPMEYDVDLTETQWSQYMIARREGRLHVVVDASAGTFVMAQQIKPGKFDSSQLPMAEGMEITDQAKVIAMGKLGEAKGTVDNADGKRK
jgi:hypothetical protein